MGTDELAPADANELQSLSTSFEVLEVIQRLEEPGVTRIAEELDVAKSTVFDHLTTLQSHDFVVKSDDSYRVGLRFLDFGGRTRRNTDVFETAKPEIDKLAENTGELVNLTVEEHGMGVYLYYVEGQDAVTLDTYVGKREHLHLTAFGKAMLAHMPAQRVEAIVDRHGLDRGTDETVDSLEGLHDRLETVRERGFAVDKEERLDRLRCVAAPILSEEEELLGAVSLSGPRKRLEDDRLFNELADEVLRTSNIIEINATYS